VMFLTNYTLLYIVTSCFLNFFPIISVC
jgi:hypothetical protein